MASPTTQTRSTPGGIPLKDGYQTLIAFSLDTDVSFWEKTIKPPAVDGGEPIEITSMHNTTWITKIAQALAELQDVTLTASYDPSMYTQILSLVNKKEGSITINFADGSTLDFWGYLRIFDPQEVERGTQPEANITITPTNWDPVNNVEAGPVLTSVAGT